MRHALGLRDISVVPLELPTVCNFRNRLSRHLQEAGENPLQLIAYIQVGPNLTDDEQMTVHVLPGLKACTEPETMWTDAGYTGPTAGAACREHQVGHVPTSIHGCHVSSTRLGLGAFEWELDEAGDKRMCAASEASR